MNSDDVSKFFELSAVQVRRVDRKAAPQKPAARPVYRHNVLGRPASSTGSSQVLTDRSVQESNEFESNSRRPGDRSKRNALPDAESRRLSSHHANSPSSAVGSSSNYISSLTNKTGPSFPKNIASNALNVKTGEKAMKAAAKRALNLAANFNLESDSDVESDKSDHKDSLHFWNFANTESVMERKTPDIRSPTSIHRNNLVQASGIVNDTNSALNKRPDYDSHRLNSAATRIQRWYKRHALRNRTSQAAFRRYLEEKRRAVEQRQNTLNTAAVVNEEEVKKARRAEKARMARQQAIIELRKRRQDKDTKRQTIVQQELAMVREKLSQRRNTSDSSSASSSFRNLQKDTAKFVAKRNGRTSAMSESESRPHSSAENERPATGQSTKRPADMSSNAAAKSTESPRRKGAVELCSVNGSSAATPRRSAERAPPSADVPGRLIDLEASSASTIRNSVTLARSGRLSERTTLEDLLETLNTLERDVQLPPEPPRSSRALLNGRPSSALDAANPSPMLHSHISFTPAPVVDQRQPVPNAHQDTNAQPAANATGDSLRTMSRAQGYLDSTRLNSVLSFLDELETSNRMSEMAQHELASEVAVRELRAKQAQAEAEQQASKSAAAAATAQRPTDGDFLRPPSAGAPLINTFSDQDIDRMQHMSAVATEVTSQLLAQRLELDEKNRSIQMLQKALNQQRELTRRHAVQTDSELQKQLDSQKNEYEDTIKRHLAFIDQLIADKKLLSDKCESLVKELKAVDHKYSDRIKQMEDSHVVELQKVKEMLGAAEKLRREKWIDEKTKKIKEMTVKGLEPEIQRLIAKHKDEMRKQKALHESELLQADERAAQRYVALTEELRGQLEREREAALERERGLAKERYEKQLADEEQSYQQQRRRLFQEVHDEKERLQAQVSRQKQELEKLQRSLQDSHQQALDAMKLEFETARSEQDKRHAAELRDAEQRYRVEKEAWEEQYMRKQETWLMTKERELREQLRKERDREIELVIGRLEGDAEQSRTEHERQTENRIRRLRDKYETEVAELERTERQTLDKYNQTKARAAELEADLERLRVDIRQRDTDIADLQAKLDKLSRERERVTDVVREEFADRLVQFEQDNVRLRQEAAEMKSRHRAELERTKAEVEVVTQQKEQELAEVHKRVKAALAKKEEVVSQLREQYEAAVKRTEHLEGLLTEQRRLIGAPIAMAPPNAKSGKK